MFIESIDRRGREFRQDFSGTNPVAVGIFIAKSLIHAVFNRSIIEGYHLPGTGPVILTGNHHREEDVYKGCLAGLRDGRLSTRAVMRKSLVDPDAKESAEYLESIGVKNDDLNTRPSRMRAFVLRGIGAHPILRDNPGLGFVRWGDRVLESGQVLSIFMLPTRNEDCLLRNLQNGPAFFARRHPDVPVYPLAFSGPPDGPDRVVILPPFTYAQKVRESGRGISIEELTVMIADAIVEGLPLRVQQDWRETTRAAELTRLTPPRRPINLRP